MKKTLLATTALIALLGTLAHAAPGTIFRTVQISTDTTYTPTLQNGAIRISSGTIKQFTAVDDKPQFLTVGSTATIAGSLTALSSTTINGNLGIKGSVNQPLTVTSTTTLLGNITFNTVDSTVTFKNNVAVNGVLTATGPVALGSAGNQVTVSSNALIAGTTFLANLPLTNACGYVLGSIVQSTVTYNAQTTTTGSSSYVTTNVYASITPRCATDKVMATMYGELTSPAGNSVFATMKRGSTDLDPFAAGSGVGFCGIGDGTVKVYSMCSFAFLDSPASTSANLYQVYIKGNGGATNVWNINSFAAKIQLDEIAY